MRHVGWLPGVSLFFVEAVAVGVVLKVERRDRFAPANELRSFAHQHTVHVNWVARVAVFGYEFMLGPNGVRQFVSSIVKVNSLPGRQIAQGNNHVIGGVNFQHAGEHRKGAFLGKETDLPEIYHSPPKSLIGTVVNLTSNAKFWQPEFHPQP